MKLKAFGKGHIVAAAVVSEMTKYICCYSLDLYWAILKNC